MRQKHFSSEIKALIWVGGYYEIML